MHRKPLLVIAAVIGVGAVAAGVAYAAIPGADATIQGCYTKIGGVLRVVDSTSQCKTGFEVPITWNQKGQKGDPGINGTNGTNGTDGTDGAPGISPTVQQLLAGDANCPAGGVAITDAAGHTAYACSGQDGRNGADGQPFTGTLTSPNGLYTFSVTDDGIVLQHGSTYVQLQNDDLTVHSNNAVVNTNTQFQLNTGTALTLQAGTNLGIQAAGNATTSIGGSASTTIGGSATTTVGGSATTSIGQNASTSVGGSANLQVSGNNTMVSAGVTTIRGSQVNIN